MDALSFNGDHTIPLTVMGRKGLRPSTEGKFAYKIELGARKNYFRLAERLARCDDLYRNGSDGLGLIQVLPSGQARLIRRGSDLAPILADRISMVVTKDGKVTGELPQAAHLNAMLRSEVFLTNFLPVDEVVTSFRAG